VLRQSLLRHLFSACTLAGVLGLASAASASSATNTIFDITIEGTNHARVFLAGSAIGGRPACHSSAYPSHYQWDISTSKGRAMLAALQGAQLAGKRVFLAGATTCTTALATIETLTSVTVWTN
jgi:hypothetical protein